MTQETLENEPTTGKESTEYQLSSEPSVYDPESTSAADEHIEYVDPGESYEDSETLQTPKKPSKFKKIFLYLILCIFIILIVYKVVTWVIGGSEKLIHKIEKREAVATQKIAKKAPTTTTEDLLTPNTDETQPPTAIAPIEPATTSTAVTTPSTTPSAEEAASQQPSPLAQEAQQLQATNKILAEHLSTQQVSNQKQFVSLQKKITSLKDNVSGLQSGVRRLTHQVKKNISFQKAESIKRTHAKQIQDKTTRHRKSYFVQAVIPGRAWLRGIDGSTETVTMGDSVPGYGKVTGIDSYSGIVSTTSGYKIHYGVTSQ